MDRPLRWMGTVTRPHGVRGEMKVRPETDDPYRFEELTTLYLGADEASAERFDVRSVAFQPLSTGVAVLLGLSAVTTREAAERLAGMLVFAAEEDLPPLEEGEYFLGDLVGMEAVDEVGTVIGRVVDVLEAPAQPLLVLDLPGSGQVLVPLVDEFVTEVDPGAGRLVLRPIEGLLDPDAQEEA